MPFAAAGVVWFVCLFLLISLDTAFPAFLAHSHVEKFPSMFPARQLLPLTLQICGKAYGSDVSLQSKAGVWLSQVVEGIMIQDKEDTLLTCLHQISQK